MKIKFKTLAHDAFEGGILLKGLNSVLECIGGVLLLTIHPQTINRLAIWLTQNELSEDPKDFFANLLTRASNSLSLRGEIFGGLFLLSHGLVKIFLVIALYKKKLWAYPLSMIVFSLFVAYELYRFYLSHSAWMVILSFLDATVIILTYMEYQNLKTRAIG
jgi:uncharacterized membrane protein